MTDVQAYRFEPELVPNAGDTENVEVNYRLLVSDVKPCQHKENVLVPENNQSQKTKWKE